MAVWGWWLSRDSVNDATVLASGGNGGSRFWHGGLYSFSELSDSLTNCLRQGTVEAGNRLLPGSLHCCPRNCWRVSTAFQVIPPPASSIQEASLVHRISGNALWYMVPLNGLPQCVHGRDSTGIADTFKQQSCVRFILNSKPSRLQRPYLLSEGHSLLSISHTLNVYEKRSPTLVHWPCGREVWWDLSMQRYDFFLNKQTFKPEICKKRWFPTSNSWFWCRKSPERDINKTFQTTFLLITGW